MRTFSTTELTSCAQDRENEARFGATPVPGKIGMAMAGQGLHAQPPPRPAAHNIYGGGQNPGNQLYVGNVSDSVICLRICVTVRLSSFLTKRDGKI